jgi:hypothetical protein
MTPVGKTSETGAGPCGTITASVLYSSGVLERCPVRVFKEMKWGPKSHWKRTTRVNVGSPKGRESYGDRVLVVVAGVTTRRGGREGRLQGEGAQVTDTHNLGRMRNAER